MEVKGHRVKKTPPAAQCWWMRKRPLHCPSSHPPRPRVGTGRGRVVWVPRPMREPTRVQCRHEALAVGQRCPVCGQGTLYALPLGWRYALTAKPSSALCATSSKSCGARRAVRFLRRDCLKVWVTRKYSAQARAVLAVGRYLLGVPGYRLQGYQAMLGVPVPDATQWEQIEAVGDCA